MGLFSILERGIQAMFDEVMTPDSFKKGMRFENYVRDHIFTRELYDIIDRAPKYDPKDFVESCLKPDFKFRDKRTRKEFYVEAKFRSHYNQGKLLTFKDGQLERYRSYLKEAPVYLILGFGDYADEPELVSLMRIEAIKKNEVHWPEAKWFEIEAKKAVILLP